MSFLQENMDPASNPNSCKLKQELVQASANKAKPELRLSADCNLNPSFKLLLQTSPSFLHTSCREEIRTAKGRVTASVANSLQRAFKDFAKAWKEQGSSLPPFFKIPSFNASLLPRWQLLASRNSLPCASNQESFRHFIEQAVGDIKLQQNGEHRRKRRAVVHVEQPKRHPTSPPSMIKRKNCNMKSKQTQKVAAAQENRCRRLEDFTSLRHKPPSTIATLAPSSPASLLALMSSPSPLIKRPHLCSDRSQRRLVCTPETPELPASYTYCRRSTFTLFTSISRRPLSPRENSKPGKEQCSWKRSVGGKNWTPERN